MESSYIPRMKGSITFGGLFAIPPQLKIVFSITDANQDIQHTIQRFITFQLIPDQIKKIVDLYPRQQFKMCYSNLQHEKIPQWKIQNDN